MSAAVDLSSGEVCWTIQREIDHATDETRPGLLVAYKAMLELTTRRAPMASVAIGVWNVARDPEEPCVTPVKWVDREELREMYKPHLIMHATMPGRRR